VSSGPQAHDGEEFGMAETGRLAPEPPDDSSSWESWLSYTSSPLERPGQTHRLDEELEEILRQIAPGSRPDSAWTRDAQIDLERRLVAHAKAESFDGPKTNKLLWYVFDYAYPVTRFLIGTEQIFKRCRQLGRPVRRQADDRYWSEEDRDFLTEASVDLGVFYVLREHGLKNARWDPRYGTTLRTYGANACSLCFPSTYRQWWRGRVLENGFADLADDLPDWVQVDRRLPDPGDRAANWDEAAYWMQQMSQPVREALWLRGVEGMTQAEAAAAIGLTEKALEDRLGRTRKQLGLTGKGPPKISPDPPTSPEPGAQEG
jgi:Sigma-70, region 4